MADLLIRALPVRLEAAYCYRLKENQMPVKLIVMYPRPKDVQAFETVHNRLFLLWISELQICVGPASDAALVVVPGGGVEPPRY